MRVFDLTVLCFLLPCLVDRLIFCFRSGLTWHFQDTDPDYGQTQAKNLQLHFEQMLAVSIIIILARLSLALFATPLQANLCHNL